MWSLQIVVSNGFEIDLRRGQLLVAKEPRRAPPERFPDRLIVAVSTLPQLRIEGTFRAPGEGLPPDKRCGRSGCSTLLEHREELPYRFVCEILI